ncbi:MAG: RdgB/HAM1 family non-canonical purine NTP pyrophosphatase [Bdellovibrionales bacterium]
MELWIASSNPGKIKEIESLLSKQFSSFHSQSELSYYSSPEETGDSFEANARIKAKSLAAVKNNVWVLADDSGLCCEGINGMPGIHSARYAGEKASDPENTAKLLKMLQLRTKNRKAYFECCLILIDPNGNEKVFTGRLDGEIDRKQSGKGGFGYDPVFVPEGSNTTLAEMGPADKNQISHRAKALRDLKLSLSE